MQQKQCIDQHLSIAEATPMVPVLKNVAKRVAERHQVPSDCIVINAESKTEDFFVQGREADIELVFRNVIDNAVKYSLPEPHVDVDGGIKKEKSCIGSRRR